MIVSIRAVLAAVILVVLSGLSVTAQPRGACVLADGTWCWPIDLVQSGHACACQTPEGVKAGVAH